MSPLSTRANKGLASSKRILSALRLSTREIDLKGWYREGEVIGILFTDIPDTSGLGLEGVMGRIRQQFSSMMDDPRIQKLTISSRIILDEVETRKPTDSLIPALSQRKHTCPKEVWLHPKA